jgi:hypothetical protein
MPRAYRHRREVLASEVDVAQLLDVQAGVLARQGVEVSRLEVRCHKQRQVILELVSLAAAFEGLTPAEQGTVDRARSLLAASDPKPERVDEPGDEPEGAELEDEAQAEPEAA